MTLPGGDNGPGLFIFDLDGTLVHFAVDWQDVKSRLADLLEIADPLTPLLPSIARLHLDPERRRKVYELIDDVEVASARSFVRDDGIVRLFRGLKADRKRIGLVTLQGRRPAVEALTRLDILESIDVIVTRDEFATRKQQIGRCLAILRVPGSSSVVIADRAADMAAARDFGCRTVAVGDRPNVEADFRVASVTDLIGILGLEGA
jgi:phosphoglycolate phosphatase-like HAD superfamily hydrolase